MENFKIYWGVNIIEFKQIEYFEAVSRLKSYTKAAKELFITQPSITVAIRKLEEELGVKLIERDNKSLYLTEAGEIFLMHAKEVLDKMKETTRIMADIQSNNKKILKFAFPPAMGAWLWSEIYPNFTNKYPNIDIEIEDLGTKEIKDAIKEKNFYELHMSGHKMKGSSATLGMMEIGRLSAQLEQLGRTESIQGAESIIYSIEECYTLAVKEVDLLKRKLKEKLNL